MISKKFGEDFNSTRGALTLDVSEVTDSDATGGVHTKTHADGWTITGEVHEDYYTWVNSFSATHPEYGTVAGDFEDEVTATSEEGFKHFWQHHRPTEWDYSNI